MAAKSNPLVAIVGPTASGKSALALELAAQLDGEIICADSRTIYKGMDIGTAKPSAAEQARAPHHLLDVVEPDQKFSAAQFKQLAQQAIDDITAHGKLPILVGGSGLYIDSVLFNYDFSPEAPRDPQNPRHRLKGQAPSNQKLRSNTLIIGLEVPPDQLADRLKKRVDQMAQRGFLDEIKRLAAQYPPDLAAFNAPGYRPFFQHLAGQLSLDEAKAQFLQNDLHLAKKQRTWFKRNKSIHWVAADSDPRSVVDLVTTFLNKHLLQ